MSSFRNALAKMKLEMEEMNKYSKVCEAETENYLGFASENSELHLMSCMYSVYFSFTIAYPNTTI